MGLEIVMEMKSEIEIANRSSDKPYGETRYLIRHTTEVILSDILDNKNCEGIPKNVLDYIKSTVIVTK